MAHDDPGDDRTRLQLHSYAQTLVGTTTKAVQSGHAAELAQLLGSGMNGLPPEQFELAMSVAALEMRQSDRRAYELLEAAARTVSEHCPSVQSDTLMRLYGVVLRLPGTASPRMTGEQAVAIGHLLRRHRLASSKTGVTVLPRLLSPEVTDSLMFGEVKALTRVLADGDGATALRQLCLGDSASSMYSLPKSRLATGPASYFVVVACSEARSSCAIDGAAHAAQRAHEHWGAFDGLATLSEELASVLGQPLVDVLHIASFTDASMEAFVLKRAHGSRAVLKGLLSDHGTGGAKLLAASQPVLGDGAFTLTARTRLADAAVGSVHWPQARYESAKDALHRLVQLVESEGLAIVDPESSASGQLH